MVVLIYSSFPANLPSSLSSALDRCEMMAPISRSYCPSIQWYFTTFLSAWLPTHQTLF